MAIEYRFATTHVISQEDFQRILSDRIKIPDLISSNSTSVVYKDILSIVLTLPNYTSDSPSARYWKRSLGSNPKNIIVFRFLNDADAEQADSIIFAFVQELLIVLEGDAILIYYDTLLLRYRNQLMINSRSAFWTDKRKQTLMKPYIFVEDPKPINNFS